MSARIQTHKQKFLDSSCSKSVHNQTHVFLFLLQFLSLVGKVDILDEVASIQEEAKKLTAQGVQIIIAVGHSGYNVDQNIAANVPEVDLVVGGHTNTFLYTGRVKLY